MRSRVYVAVRRPSVRPSVRLYIPSIAGRFAAERRRLQQISIDICVVTYRRRRSAANAGSVILRADGGGSPQTCFSSSGRASFLLRDAVLYALFPGNSCRCVAVPLFVTS